MKLVMYEGGSTDEPSNVGKAETMTTCRSEDLNVPGIDPEPLPANVLDFFAPPRLPFAIPAEAVLLMAQRQSERAKEKAVGRHAQRQKKRGPA